MNRPSALSPATAASDSSRSTTPNNFCTSATVAWWLTSRPLCNQFAKVIPSPLQKHLLVADDFQQERISRLVFLPEHRCGVKRRVDDATEGLLDRVQGGRQLLEPDVADDEQVQIAVAILLSA